MENKENRRAGHSPDSTETQGAEAWLGENASNAEEVRITENKWAKRSTSEAEKIEWTQEGRRKKIKKIMISNL